MRAASSWFRKGHKQIGPAIYFLHGGGMVMGNRFAGAAPLVDWAIKHNAVCVTVEYRLAPDHPAPVPVEDCYAGLLWMASHSAALKFDPDRLVIFGGSSGGGLAAGTTLMARDRNGQRLMGQLLQCPMIDDRNRTASASQYDGVGCGTRPATGLLGRRCSARIAGATRCRPIAHRRGPQTSPDCPQPLSMSARAKFSAMRPLIMPSAFWHRAANANYMSGEGPSVAFTILPLNPTSPAPASLREMADSSGC